MIKFEYKFEKKGATYKDVTAGDTNNHIWIDVGNSVSFNVFDNHVTGSNCQSTVEVVLKNPGRIENIAKGIQGEKAVIIHVHEYPDLDAMVSTRIIEQCLLEEGSKEKFLKEHYDQETGKFKKLIELVSRVDAGKSKVVTKDTLYFRISQIFDASGAIQKDSDLFDNAMSKGIEYIKWAEKRLEDNPDFNLIEDDLGIEDEFNAWYKSRLNVVKEEYDNDRNLRRDENVFVHTKSGKVETVKAYVWTAPPKIEAEYTYARADGAVITSVPYVEDVNQTKGTRISVNPDLNNDDDRYDLSALAELLEEREQVAEKRLFDKEGFLRRNYGRYRERDNADSRFSKKPFVNTSDPWYFSDKGDMVDAPGGGTLISWDEIRDYLFCYARQVEKAYITYIPEGGTEEICVNNKKDWKIECKRKIAEESEKYKILTIEINADLIAHSYELLDAFYADLADLTLIDIEDVAVLHLDYGDHLYANNKWAVLFTAVKNNGKEGGQNFGVLSDIIKLDSIEQLDKSEGISIIRELDAQKEKLFALSESLKNDDKYKRGWIRKKKEELTVISTTLQALSVQKNEISQRIHDFFRKLFGIDELVQNISSALQSLYEESADRVYGNLNILSLITVPFLLVSTLFQMGALRFGAIVETEARVLPWIITAIVVVLCTVLFIKRKR